MTDKHMMRVKQYLEDLIEKRDDLFKNVGELISNADLQAQSISKSTSLSEKEALFTYLARILVLFSELNHSVLKTLETVNPPKSVETSKPSLHTESLKATVVDSPKSVETNILSLPTENDSNSQELQDYLKMEHIKMGQGTTCFDFTNEGPKVSNDQVQNVSYVRKPLDDTTLKAICSTFIHSSTLADNLQVENTLPVNVPAFSESNSNFLKQQPKNCSAFNPCPSLGLSSYSESDVFSTISSSTCQHPLAKYCPPIEIPNQYDTNALEQVKENMKYISKKMGFDSEGFAQMTSQFDKTLSSVNFQYEEPVKEVPSEILITEKENLQDSHIIDAEHTSTFNYSPEISNEAVKLEKLNNGTPLVAPDNSLESLHIQDIDGPSRSTGAIRKQKLAEDDLIEFSVSTSDSECCDKVNSWLTHNSQAAKKLVTSTDSDTSENLPIRDCSAVDKIEKIKRLSQINFNIRYDRNEEARIKARSDMPDLRFIPAEPPQVIRNDLNSEGTSSDKTNRKIKRKKLKVKDLNKEFSIYEIQKMDLPQVGDVCVFSHIVSPSEFYLQILNDKNSADLDMISERLNQKFSKTETKFKTKQDAFSKLGKFCCGYIWGERKSWYRFQVLDWKLGCTSEEVFVQAVDYGFKYTTMYTYLRELTLDLTHIPMLAIRCHFPLLYPPGSTFSRRLTEWSISTTEALYDIAHLSRDLTQVPQDISIFEIIFSELVVESLAVDLVQHLEPNAESIGQLLIDMGFAIEFTDEYEEHPEVDGFIEDIDELEKADNLNEFLLGYDAKDEARICRFTRKDGTCYKGKNCKLEHIELKDGYTTDKTAVFYMAINDLILPNKGDMVQVLVTTYVDSCTYLVQMIRNPVKKGNTNIIMDKDISDLMDAMNHPKLIAKYVPFKIYPAIGEVILAYHPIAKKWIRVAVRELNKNENVATIEVYSLDFGDEFSMSIKDIRVMQEEFMHVPFQVIQIYLDNYQHRKGCNAEEANHFFHKHLAYKTFLAHIKTCDLPYKVSLMTYKGREVGPTLVKNQFAERRTVDLYITEDKDKRRKFDLE